jgi:hypothetical protein
LVLALVAAVVILPLGVLGHFSPAGSPFPGLNFEAAQSVLPKESPLDRSILISPGSQGPSSNIGGLIAVIDPANGAGQWVQPFGSDTEESFPWLAIGDDLVAVNGLQIGTAGVRQIGTAVAFSPLSPQRTQILGRATYVVRAFTSGAVWLVVNASFPNPAQPSDSGCTLEEVSLPGRVLMPRSSFPCGWTIDGPAVGGLLVTRPPSGHPGADSTAGSLIVWDTTNRRIQANYGAPSFNVQVDGDNGTVVIWNECPSSPCGPDSVTDLAARRSFALPSLPSGWQASSSYVLAPDGALAAVVALPDATEATVNTDPGTGPPPCCYYGVHAVTSELFVYDLRTDSIVESRSFFAASEPLVQWSADGSYVFVTRDLESIEAVPLWSDTASIRVLAVPPGTGAPVVDDVYPSESFLPVAVGV